MRWRVSKSRHTAGSEQCSFFPPRCFSSVTLLIGDRGIAPTSTKCVDPPCVGSKTRGSTCKIGQPGWRIARDHCARTVNVIRCSRQDEYLSVEESMSLRQFSVCPNGASPLALRVWSEPAGDGEERG